MRARLVVRQFQLTHSGRSQANKSFWLLKTLELFLCVLGALLALNLVNLRCPTFLLRKHQGRGRIGQYSMPQAKDGRRQLPSEVARKARNCLNRRQWLSVFRHFEPSKRADQFEPSIGVEKKRRGASCHNPSRATHWQFEERNGT